MWYIWHMDKLTRCLGPIKSYTYLHKFPQSLNAAIELDFVKT